MMEPLRGGVGCGSGEPVRGEVILRGVVAIGRGVVGVGSRGVVAVGA